MVELLERPVVIGAQEPRILVVPEGEDHPRWQEVVEFIAALGVVLDPWQMFGLRVALRRAGDVWAAFAFALCAPRQNGKNGLLEIRELVGSRILGEKLQIHTAHLADTSKEAFRRLDDLIDANEWLSREVRHIWRTNGHEAIEWIDGNRIRFRTRTRGGGRGFSGSPVYFDESMFLPDVSMGSILPVISAQPDPQIWYMGSAVDQAIMDDGVVFARVRDRALTGDHKRLAYLEYSHEAATPDMVSADEARDPDVWAASNPAFGIRISADYVEAEHREMDPRTFAVERLGVGDWPPVDGTAGQIIPAEAWQALVDGQSRLVDPVCLAYDVAPDRSMAAIAAAGRNQDGLFHVEIIDHKQGTAWLPARFLGLIGKHETAWAGCDGYALLPELEEEDLVAVKATEHGLACGRFVDAVSQQTFRHLGSDELNAAVRGAKTRPLGDAAWAWSRKGSPVDITPLVAATLALGAAMEQPEAGVGTIW